MRDKPIVIPIRNFFHSKYLIQEYNVKSIVPFLCATDNSYSSQQFLVRRIDVRFINLSA